MVSDQIIIFNNQYLRDFGGANISQLTRSVPDGNGFYSMLHIAEVIRKKVLSIKLFQKYEI